MLCTLTIRNRNTTCKSASILSRDQKLDYTMISKENKDAWLAPSPDVEPKLKDLISGWYQKTTWLINGDTLSMHMISPEIDGTIKYEDRCYLLVDEKGNRRNIFYYFDFYPPEIPCDDSISILGVATNVDGYDVVISGKDTMLVEVAPGQKIFLERKCGCSEKAWEQKTSIRTK